MDLNRDVTVLDVLTCLVGLVVLYFVLAAKAITL
jgi:hypothetical protein